MAAVTQTASPTLAYPARVTLPPASVRVVAAAGAGLVTQLHVQAGDTVKRGAPLVTLSMPGLADAQNRACAQRNPRCSRHAPASWRRRLRCRCWGREGVRQCDHADRADRRRGDGKCRRAGERVDAGMALVKVADLARLALEIPLSTA